MKKALLGMVLAAAAGTAHAQEKPDIMGTWNVMAKPTGFGNCDGVGENQVMQWLVAENNGSVNIKVVDDSDLPKMTGSLEGNELTIEGVGQRPLGSGFAGVHPAIVFKLALKGGKLNGTSYTLASRPSKSGGGTVLCMVEHIVTATKQ